MRYWRSLGVHALFALLFLSITCQAADDERQRNLPALLEYVQSHPSDTAARLQLARELAFSKKYAEAASQYSTLLGQEPGSLPAKIGLAKVASWQGELDRSLALYDEVLRHSPHLYDAIVGKGFTLAWMGRNEEALDLLRRAARMHPEDREVSAEVSKLISIVPKTLTQEVTPRISSRERKKFAAPLPAPASVAPQPFPEPIAPARALAAEPRPTRFLVWVPAGLGVIVLGLLISLWRSTRHKSKPPKLESKAARKTKFATKRVLLVEANEEAAIFVRMLFAQLGAEVERLPDVNQLFVTHRKRPADLVLVDGDCDRSLFDEVIETGLGRAASVAFACSTVAESQVVHEAGFRSIRKPFRILDLALLLEDGNDGTQSIEGMRSTGSSPWSTVALSDGPSPRKLTRDYVERSASTRGQEL